jgi:hypothetical protein
MHDLTLANNLRLPFSWPERRAEIGQVCHKSQFHHAGQRHRHAAVRNAYADRIGYVADLADKTERLVEESAIQDGLGRLIKTVTFDVKTLEALRGEPGSDEGKVFNLVRGLQKEIDEDSDSAPGCCRRAHARARDLFDPAASSVAPSRLLAARGGTYRTGRRRFFAIGDGLGDCPRVILIPSTSKVSASGTGL